MKRGDIICYNAAGQRSKTLGLLVKIDRDYNDDRVLLIYWAVIGDRMPRVSGQKPPSTWGAKAHAGELCWHLDGGWFEVVVKGRGV